MNTYIGMKYWYENGGYQLASSIDGKLTPTKGYWLMTKQNCELLLSPLPSPPKARVYTKQDQIPDGWKYKISATFGNYNDTYNFIGQKERGKDGDDVYDAYKPPVIGEYVSVYFSAERLAVSDNRKPTTENRGITFRHKTQGSIQRITIEVYNLADKLVDKFEGDTTNDETYWPFGDRLSNGVYIYRITISDGIKQIARSGKMVVVR